MRIVRTKLNGVRIVTMRVLQQNVRAWYIKEMERKLTISEATELGVLRTFQLALLVVQQTGVANLSVSLVKKIFHL